MPPRLEFEFSYVDGPIISVVIRSLQTGLTFSTDAWIDTGAEISVFDEVVARLVGLDLTGAPTGSVVGIGGQTAGRLAEVELLLLGEPELSAVPRVAFVRDQETALGNLLGLDVLSQFDFGLSHAQRLGYLGRVSA
jgi:predicted aspartyl protease